MVRKPRIAPLSIHRARRGMANMEVVYITALGVSITFFLVALGYRGCKFLYELIAILVGWPYL